MELSPGTVVDRYTVDTLLGRGGMATVYRVRHNQLGSLHALKVLHTGGPHVTERLVLEGRLQGGLHHPGVLRVTDLVEIEGHPALVLEFVDGCTLEELLNQSGRLDDERADWLARRILEAVAAAHRHGLIHRDLKPGNVLLSEVDGTLQPKVADFGLAKALDTGSGPTATGVAMGTPAYMAPEQFRDAAAVDARADVFSLGAMLYELVTGRRAFEGDSMQEVMWRTVNGDYTPVRDHGPLPAAWEAAIDGALRSDPDERIGSVEDLLAIWGGDAAAPAWKLPEHVPTFDAPTGLHPSMSELMEQADAPHIAEHLASCAACRVERKLYREAFSVEGHAPRRWPRGLAGAGLGALTGLAVLAAGLGGLGQLVMLGPWWPPLLVLAAIGGARLGVGSHALAAGRGKGLVSWHLSPALLLVLGMAGCGMGAMVAAGVLPHAAVVDVPAMVAAGASVTLMAWSAAQLLATALLLATLGLVVWTRRLASRAFDPGPVGVAIGGGAVLWLAEAVLATDRTATLLVYATVVAAGGLLALLPDEGPADAHGRLVGGTAAALAGASAALGVQILDLQALLEEAAHSQQWEPAEGALAAQAFGEAWSQALNPWTLAWVGLAALVGLAVLLRGRARLPGAGRDLGRLAAVLVVVVGPAAAWNARVTQELVDALVPAWQAAAVAAQVPGLVLRAEGEGLVAAAEAMDPLVPGDQLVAVDGLAFHEAAPLVEHLAERDGPEVVPVTVTREQRLLEIELSLASE